MIPTGRVIQVPELLGRPYVLAGDKPPYGELHVDDAGNPVAVVAYMRVALPIPGLAATVEDGPGGLQKVVYMREEHEA